MSKKSEYIIDFFSSAPSFSGIECKAKCLVDEIDKAEKDKLKNQYLAMLCTILFTLVVVFAAGALIGRFSKETEIMFCGLIAAFSMTGVLCYKMIKSPDEIWSDNLIWAKLCAERFGEISAGKLISSIDDVNLDRDLEREWLYSQADKPYFEKFKPYISSVLMKRSITVFEMSQLRPAIDIEERKLNIKNNSDSFKRKVCTGDNAALA